MKVTLNWLKQYVDFNWSPEELTERLTMLGLEVEGVQKLGGEFNGIVVAQVITRDKHPNADKLSVCRVNDGTGERQIVCGAQNFQAGDKVPLILPGAALPMKPGDKEPFTIKVGKIRSVESHGMMCSPAELCLPDQVDGLLILRADATHNPTFHQIEGLYVDKNVTVSDLKGTVEFVFKELMGSDVKLRFRPHYFSYTEPSMEIDFTNALVKKLGKDWLEIAGCGMVHPQVFVNVGYDPEVWTGWAFGFGIERIAMLRYGINDIRLFYENDTRFLRQF